MTADDQVVVVGGGPVGVLIATVARRRGARVLLVEPDPFRRAVAAGIGIEAVDPASDRRAWRWSTSAPTARAPTSPSRCPAPPAGVSTAVDVLTTRGRLVMVAIHPQPRDRSTCTGSSGASWSCSAPGCTSATTWWRRSGWSPPARSRREQLISRVVPVDAVGAAFAALEGGGVMKVLLDWQEGNR